MISAFDEGVNEQMDDATKRSIPIDEANGPLRCKSSVFALTPCRGLSPSR
jgi:hypothetical protein